MSVFDQTGAEAVWFCEGEHKGELIKTGGFVYLCTAGGKKGRTEGSREQKVVWTKILPITFTHMPGLLSKQ